MKQSISALYEAVDIVRQEMRQPRKCETAMERIEIVRLVSPIALEVQELRVSAMDAVKR
jgi:hypothetical protein